MMNNYQLPPGDLLPVAVRAYMELNEDKPKSTNRKRFVRQLAPLKLLAIDVETLTQDTLDNPDKMPGFDPDIWRPHAMPLLFGCAHLWTRKKITSKWKLKTEYTFFPDNLPSATLVKLRRCFYKDNWRVGDWREPKDSPGVKSYFVSLTEFLNIFHKEAVRPRCLIAGYNVNFDLSRLAYRVGDARSKMYRGGFSFMFWPDLSGKYNHCLYHPKLFTKALGQKSTLIKFSTFKLGENVNKYSTPRCRLLDLTQFCGTLIGVAGLDKVADALGLDVNKKRISGHGIINQNYVRYNRQDTLITAQAAFEVLKRFDRHPVSRAHFPPGPLTEDKVFSGASIAKGYLKTMGITPRMKLQPNFSTKALAVAMEAYSGGRAESRIWNLKTPVAPLDIVSEYPTIMGLQDIWDLIIAEKVRVVRCVRDIRKLIKNITLDDLYNPETWKQFNGFARIKPDGETLPVKVKFPGSGSWKLGNSPYYIDDGSQWFAIADLAAAKIRTPEIKIEILEAFRLIPDGIQEGLKSVEFGGSLAIDPQEDDFFIKIVEERARIKQGLTPYKGKPAAELEALSTSLKIMAVSGSYGIFVETNPQALPSLQTVEVELMSSDSNIDSLTVTTHNPEKSGLFYFSPFGSLITAGGRLLLAILQVEVENRGASYALCDTDGMCVTYKKGGGEIEMPGIDRPIVLLNDEQLDEIIERFDSMSPYDPDIIPHLIKKEYKKDWPLFAFSIGPKRYGLFNSSGKAIIISESALGGIISPTGEDKSIWMRTWWECIVSGDSLPFADVPLMRRYTIKSWEFYKRVSLLNEGLTYQQQIKPYNFLLMASPDPFTPSKNAGPLIAPFETDPNLWLTLPWLNLHTGRKVSVTLDMIEAAKSPHTMVCVQTFGQYFQKFKNFKPLEFKRPPGDKPGYLQPRPVRRDSLTFIGKISKNFMELAEVGLIDPEPLEITSSTNGGGSRKQKRSLTFGKSKLSQWDKRFTYILKDLPKTTRIKFCKEHRVTERSWLRWGNYETQPGVEFIPGLKAACINFAEHLLLENNLPIPDHHINLITTCAALIFTIRTDAKERLEMFTEEFSIAAAAREFEIDRRTVQSWIDRPERIPIEKAVTINNALLSHSRND